MALDSYDSDFQAYAGRMFVRDFLLFRTCTPHVLEYAFTTATLWQDCIPMPLYSFNSTQTVILLCI